MNAAATILALAAAVMLGYGPGFCLAVKLAERRDRKQEVARRAHLSSEWSRLTALQDKARAEIDAEDGHFQLWEQEVSA
jgi:hypothetical protein